MIYKYGISSFNYQVPFLWYRNYDLFEHSGFVVRVTVTKLSPSSIISWQSSLLGPGWLSWMMTPSSGTKENF